MKFYNRYEEKKAITEIVNSKQFQLLVLSGRRRVGKTSLIKQINQINLYFYVASQTTELLLENFTQQLRKFLKEEYLEFKTWDGFLNKLFSIAKKRKIVVVFDEFQNFKEIDMSFFSLLQKYCDYAEEENIPIKIIAMGSYITMIKDIFNTSSSALYGRKTSEMVIRPLNFKYIVEILNDLKIKDKKDIIEIYGLFGGIARYYRLIEGYRFKNYNDLLENALFSMSAPLKSEIKEIFFEDVVKIKKEYSSILNALSLGYNSNKKISDYTGIEKTSLPVYLNELENVYEIIERKIPITDDISKSKKGIYVIKDNFLLFWFKFIEKYKSDFEFMEFDFIKENIEENFSDHIGKNVFENLAQEYVRKKYKGFRVGSWWRVNTEIDIVGYNFEKSFIFGECKWSNKKVGFSLYNELLKKINLVEYDRVEKIVLFSKSGFEKPLKDKANDLNIELVDLDKLFEVLCE